MLKLVHKLKNEQGEIYVAKVTKADLLKEIEGLNKRLTEAHEVNMRLVNEKAAMVDKADEEFENSSTYKQMTKEIDMLKLHLKTTDGIKESYKNRCSEKDKVTQEILKENEELKIENSRLNGELGRQICDKSDLRKEIDSLNKKIELDNAFYKDNDTMKKKLDETLILSAQKTSKMLEEYRLIVKRLEEELENNNSVHKIKNERGAGRKERFTDRQKEEIKEYSSQGKSIREIAEIYKCSTGLIHKLINEKSNS